MPRTRDELVLDAPVVRQDPELADRAAVEAAERAARLDHAASEVGLEACREAQRGRVVAAREPRDVAAAADQIAQLRPRAPPRRREVLVRLEAVIGRMTQQKPDGVTCDKQCQTIPIACGNGIVQPGEQCEPPNTNTCDASCHTVEFPVEFPVEFCGDEILESNEECDDGNTVSGDGCSSDCRIEGSACSDFPCGRRGSKVELCHVPPGNERQKHTLCIAPSAVPAHLTHHPVYCGPCDFHHSRRGEDDSRRGKKKDDARKGRGR
ncbi:MAG: DUF4215 domain-containing protein [Deltaproteobacteria bacterium]|nr:MAG: DUF4215 domain-containing protein [Deltaproteobacteria bacterium]